MVESIALIFGQMKTGQLISVFSSRRCNYRIFSGFLPLFQPLFCLNLIIKLILICCFEN